MHFSYIGIIAHRVRMHITIHPCLAGPSDDQLNDIFLSQDDTYSFNMVPSALLTVIYITRYNEPKMVSEHTGHAVVIMYLG